MADNNPSHGELLSHSLQQLQLQTEAAAHAAEERGRSEDMPGKEAHFASSPSSALANRLDRIASSSLIREGYGFRPSSGISTPALNEAFTEGERGSPLPDPNGLGWPGAQHVFVTASVWVSNIPRLCCTAKSTVMRLNATPDEKTAREQKLSAAVRTVLECIGEDPDREGLLRTPERYAKALMWMTRGYEERLTGASHLLSASSSLN